MNPEGGIVKRKSLFSRIKNSFLEALRLTDKPLVKVYSGFGNDTHCYVFGHVFSFSPVPRKKYRQNFLSNTLALIRLFMVKPVSGAKVQFTWEEKVYHAETAKDGFFRFDFSPSAPLKPGWHPVSVTLLGNRGSIAVGEAHICIPHPGQYTFISDIDDTFLISHSSNLRKRLYVLLTENARSRQPFEGVVNHYQLLADTGTSLEYDNPFFYVSSSEWNLYDYIREFSSVNKLPAGVYLLNQVKQLREVLRTGQNNHGTKFMRIARIMEAYPQQDFILLGDDSQEDPVIYASIVSHFRDKVKAVYIRKVTGRPKDIALEKISEMETAGVRCCYFEHSAEAVIHSKQIGLIIV